MSEREDGLKQASIDWMMHGSLNSQNFVGVRLGYDERGDDFIEEVIGVSTDREVVLKALEGDVVGRPGSVYVINEPADSEGSRWGDVYKAD